MSLCLHSSLTVCRWVSTFPPAVPLSGLFFALLSLSAHFILKSIFLWTNPCSLLPCLPKTLPTLPKLQSWLSLQSLPGVWGAARLIPGAPAGDGEPWAVLSQQLLWDAQMNTGHLQIPSDGNLTMMSHHYFTSSGAAWMDPGAGSLSRTADGSSLHPVGL